MNQTTSSSQRRLSDAEVLRAVPPMAGAREFRVGIFVILGVAGFLAVLYLMTSPALFRGRYMVVTEVPSAQGIRHGDPVRMRGINIGRVYGFELAPSGGVLLTLELEGEYRIPGPARAELSAEGVLGGMVVSVMPGPGPEMVAPGTLIPGQSIQGVFEAAGSLAGPAADVMSRIQRALADSTIMNTGESIEEFRDLLVELNRIIDGQAEGMRALTETLGRAATNVEGITALEDWTQALASATTALATLERTTETTESALASLDTILGGLARGEGTLGLLLASDSLYQHLDQSIVSLNELLVDLRENPDRYVRIEIF